MLNLFQGSWWEDATIGTPMFQSILGGQSQGSVIPLILQKQILSVPYVTSVSNIAISYNPQTRAYGFSCTAQTAFGPVSVTSGNTSAYIGT